MRKRKNPILKSLLHFFVTLRYRHLSFRGGWILAHFFYKDYKAHKGSLFKILNAHKKGWSYSDWCILGINDTNRKQYLSTYDYCTLHPLNKEYSQWIDDKLTLKYILHGTPAGIYMPDYYFQIESDGTILSLMDCTDGYRGLEGIVRLLQEKKTLAFKLIKASLGLGFYKAEYTEDKKYLLNGEEYDEDRFVEKIKGLRGYLVTEYLKPHEAFKKYCDKSVGCLRYIVGRSKEGEIVDIYSFMRLGTKRSRFVENYNSGGVLVIVDSDGQYSFGNVIDYDRYCNVRVDKHPDNGIELKGQIPFWDNIVSAAHTVAETLPQLTYMGIDFCVTDDNRIKIIEINSLTSLDSIQLDKSIYETQGGVFFKERLS